MSVQMIITHGHISHNPSYSIHVHTLKYIAAGEVMNQRGQSTRTRQASFVHVAPLEIFTCTVYPQLSEPFWSGGCAEVFG